MAVSYQIPPWVRAANPLAGRLQAYQIGLQAAQAAARQAIAQQELNHRAQALAQDAQQAQMRFNIAQQEQQRKAAHDEQQMRVLEEYHRQQADLGQAKLEEQKQKVEQAATLMAHKFAAQKAIQDDYFKIRQENPDMAPERAITLATLMHATEVQMPGGGIGSLARAAAAVGKGPFVPGNIKGFDVEDKRGNVIPDMVAVPNATGTGMVVHKRSDFQKPVRGRPGEYANIIGRRGELGLSNEAVKDYEKLMEAEKNERLKAIGETPTPPAPPPEPELSWWQKHFGVKAKPETPAQATLPDQVSTPESEKYYPTLTKETKPVEGELYQTSKGLLYYDGKNFIVPRSKGMEDTTPMAEAEQAAPEAQVADSEMPSDDEEELAAEEA